MFFGVDYYPEQWVFPYSGTADKPEGAWEHDAELMAQAGINVVRIGEFSWGICESKEGKYDFAWLRRVMDIMQNQNIKVVLGTPTAAPPSGWRRNSPESCRSTSAVWSNTKARAGPPASTTTPSGTLPSGWSKTWPGRWGIIHN